MIRKLRDGIIIHSEFSSAMLEVYSLKTAFSLTNIIYFTMIFIYLFTSVFCSQPYKKLAPLSPLVNSV